MSSLFSLTGQYSWEDLLHAVSGLCSVALPDMEDSAIYSSLTRSGSKTIVLLSTSRVGELQCSHKQREKRTITTSSETEAKTTPTSAAPQSTGSSCEVENPFLEVFSESDSSDNERCAPFNSKSIFGYVFHILLKVHFLQNRL